MAPLHCTAGFVCKGMTDLLFCNGKYSLMRKSIINKIKCGAWSHVGQISPLICREEKPTRCHQMVYCTYNMLSIFRALLCPSSGARDCVLIPPMVCEALVAGCWGSGAGQLAVRLG